MKVVYIAGPFTASNAWAIEQNIRLAETCAMNVVEVGAMPLIPHANTRYFHGTATPEFWYAGTLELLRRCDAILLVLNWESSKGARAERDEALRLKIPVFENLVDLAMWLQKGTPDAV